MYLTPVSTPVLDATRTTQAVLYDSKGCKVQVTEATLRLFYRGYDTTLSACVDTIDDHLETETDIET